MADDFDGQEDELQHRQNGRLYPVGRSLRSTFPPADGEDLQPKMTRLMVELAHQPYERVDERRVAVANPSSFAPQPMPPSSFLHQIGRLFRRAH